MSGCGADDIETTGNESAGTILAANAAKIIVRDKARIESRG